MPIQTDRLNSALFGRYRVERHLGEGGMATVYLAEDLKHDRKVALKLLKPELAAVLGAERFVQEIKTTASLQHPHILPLFDSGTADGFLYYVMPYIEGVTLREKLNRETQLGVEESIRIAREVADALDYAHRHGVIHRDIKPENILLHDGRPMVADFGIALAVSAAAGGRMTETGLSLGTPHYMSPEQATAEKEITARSDIYSLGSVLFEMLTGTPPHTGASAQQIIMKIITEPAEAVTKYRKSVPPHVAAAVAKSLEKLPADRFETAKAFGDALGNPSFVMSRSTMPASIGAGSGFTGMWLRRVRAIAPWAIAVTALAILLTNRARETPVSDPPLRYELTFPSDVAPILTGAGPRVAISPDGSRIVYVGPGEQGMGTRLYTRALDDFASVPLRGTGGAFRPQFSPDGRWIAFAAPQGRLMRIPALGGPAMTIVDSAGSYHWGDGGIVVFQWRGGLWRVNAAGGVPERLTSPDTVRGETSHSWPFVLPGGKAVVFVVLQGSAATGELAAVRLNETRTVVPLGVRAVQPRYVPEGFILAGNLDGYVVAVPFDASQLRVTGPSVTILETVEVRGGGATEISISANGTLVHVTGTLMGTDQAMYVDRTGRERVLIKDEGDFRGPRISPNGRQLLVERRVSAASPDIWIYDIPSGSRTRLTSDGASAGGSWSADGQRIVWVSNRPSGPGGEILQQAWDGGGSAARLAAPKPFPVYVTVAPNDAFLMFELNIPGPDDIGMMSLDSARVVSPVLATPADEGHTSISPDARWYAYTSTESGRAEVYVRSINARSGRVSISIGGGSEPVWSPSGAEIFYRSGTHMMSARVATDPEFRVLRRDTLFADPYKFAGAASTPQAYDVMPNGAGFVMLKQLTSGVKHLVVATQWIDELKRRMSEAQSK